MARPAPSAPQLPRQPWRHHEQRPCSRSHLAGQHGEPAAGLEALIYRDWNTTVWIAPARLGDRVNHRALRATWHAVAAGDHDRARATRLLNAVERGLDHAFDLDLLQQPVQRDTVVGPPWWDEHSDEGFVVLGAVLGYPPASTYARLIGL